MKLVLYKGGKEALKLHGGAQLGELSWVGISGGVYGGEGGGEMVVLAKRRRVEGACAAKMRYRYNRAACGSGCGGSRLDDASPLPRPPALTTMMDESNTAQAAHASDATAVPPSARHRARAAAPLESTPRAAGFKRRRGRRKEAACWRRQPRARRAPPTRTS